MFFDNWDSLKGRLTLAQSYGLGGMNIFTLGDELPSLFELIQSNKIFQ